MSAANDLLKKVNLTLLENLLVTKDEGIPQAKGIPNMIEAIQRIAGELGISALDVGKLMRDQLNSLKGRYQIITEDIEQQILQLKVRMDDMQETLKMILLLKNVGHAEKTIFQLSETTYREAKIPKKVEKVHLWLGGNIMMEYTLEEGETFIRSSIDATTAKSQNLMSQLADASDQRQIMELNFNRTHNFVVMSSKDTTQT